MNSLSRSMKMMMMLVAVLLLVVMTTTTVQAFATSKRFALPRASLFHINHHQQQQHQQQRMTVLPALFMQKSSQTDDEDQIVVVDNDDSVDSLALSFQSETESMSSSSSSSLSSNWMIGWTTALLMVMTVNVGSALANGDTAVVVDTSPNWGIFEGRIGSLLHPITMFALLVYSISTALLGFDWRRLRTIGDEISALKRITLPKLPEGITTVKAALASANQAETKDVAYITTLQQALEIEENVQALQEERKQLSQKAPRDKHFAQGALLAFVGTAFAIEGPLNTYARAGKLFPGPHLYAGAGLVVLWALASSCVPSMIKGNETARIVHISANVAGIALFAWQLTTGIPILQKVLENTHWP